MNKKLSTLALELLYAESGWRRFSFLDYIWLKIIMELRIFNVPLETIKKLKDKLFAPFNILGETEFIKEMILSGKIPLPPDVLKEDCLEYVDEIRNMITPFIFTVINAVRTRNPFCLLISLDGEFEFMDLFTPEVADVSKEILMELVIEKNFISINIQKILEQFYSNKKVKPGAFESIFTLTEKEKQILSYIRNGQFQEIRIKELKNKEYILSIKREVPAKEVEIQVRGVLARGTYDEVSLTRDNGHVVSCYRVEKIKV